LLINDIFLAHVIRLRCNCTRYLNKYENNAVTLTAILTLQCLKMFAIVFYYKVVKLRKDIMKWLTKQKHTVSWTHKSSTFSLPDLIQTDVEERLTIYNEIAPAEDLFYKIREQNNRWQ